MNNYTILDRFFHNFIFSSKFIQKSLYEFQKFLFKNAENFNENNHIFISGLPRSGSTVFLYYLYQSNLFASLTYRDMPFVISPRLNLFNKKNIQKRERLHNDGLKFDLDTPEALDNVFFQLFNDKEIDLELENYTNSILEKYKKKRYLSKNNNIFRKLNLIKKKFQKSFFLIPFRNPENQSYSLYKQHLNFIELHKRNKFSLKYMSDLGHFEFGKNHKPWFQPINFKDALDINYWLEQWFLYYSYIHENYAFKKNFLFMSYEKFCDDLRYRKKLSNKLNIDKNVVFNLKNNNQNDVKIRFDNTLIKKCNQLHTLLDAQFL